MRRFNPHYDLKLIMKYGFLIVAFFLLCKVTRSMAFPILVPVSLYYLMQRKFEALYFIMLILIVSIVCNSWLIPKPMIYAVTQRGLLMLIGALLLLSVFGRRNAPQVSPMRAFLVYIVYMVFVSFAGWSPLISELKLALFISIFMAYYASTNGVATQKHGMRKMRSMVLACLGLFLLGSVCVIPFPAIGYMGYDELKQSLTTTVSLFKGLTVHSQTLGPVVATCSVLLFGDMVFSIQRMDKLYLLLLATAPLLIIKTSSRTALGGALAGILFVFWCAARARTVNRNWRSRLVQGCLLGGALACMAILMLPSMRDRVSRYVIKYSEDGEKVELSSDSILATRRDNLEYRLYNWRRSPIIGNGFQVSDEMEGFQAHSFADIMTAPVEKSTWIFAILEEGGAVGEIIFCLSAFYILSMLMKRRAYIGASCFFTMIVLNLGEFSMFSLSGVGGFIWGMVFVGCAMDARRNRELQVSVYR